MRHKNLNVKVSFIDGNVVRLTDTTTDTFIEFPLNQLEDLIDALCHYQWLGRGGA